MTLFLMSYKMNLTDAEQKEKEDENPDQKGQGDQGIPTVRVEEENYPIFLPILTLPIHSLNVSKAYHCAYVLIGKLS